MRGILQFAWSKVVLTKCLPLNVKSLSDGYNPTRVQLEDIRDT